jgi:transcriptional regulator with XRE-family HTH domain
MTQQAAAPAEAQVLTPLQLKIQRLSDAGLSMAQIGQLWGIDQAQISRWRQGKTRPSTGQLANLADATKLSLAELIQ